MRFNKQYVNQKVLEIDHYHIQYERFWLTTVYHKYVLNESVKLAKIRPCMSVLDYGCGRQMLRHVLPKDVHYVGYDIVPEFSDIEGIHGCSCDVIFAIQVLQYPDQTGLRELVNLFAKLSDRLVVMVPAENRLKRFLDFILGLKEDNKIFLSKTKEIYQLLDSLFRCEKIKTVFGMGEISCWKRR